MNNEQDISTEIRRIYTWGDGSEVIINYPTILIVSENGHRILDIDNNGHYIPKGWIHLMWENKPGAKGIVV